MQKKITGVAALTAAALTLSLAGTAHAESIGVTDPKDIAHGVDLRAVHVKNGDRNVVVTTSHTNLRRDFRSGASGAVYVDTDPADRGPEYVFVGGYFEGTDYSLLETEGFGHRKWGERVVKSHAMTIDYDKERVRMRMSRAALGRPGDVRVAVRVVGTRSDGSSDGLVDWLGERRELTEWVARG